MRRALSPVLLTLITCLVACVSYVGVITTGALLTLLLPATAAVALVGGRLRHSTLPGLIIVAVLSFLAGQVVNLLSGEFQGPAARGTFLAAAASGIAMVLSGSRMPALMLVPIGGVVVGALVLGAGGQVQLVAIVTAGLALLALAAVERESRAMVEPQRASASFLLAFLLVTFVGVFAALFHGQYDTRIASAPLRTTINESVRPPGLVSLPSKARDKAREELQRSRLPVVGEDVPVATPSPTRADPTRPAVPAPVRPTASATVRPTASAPVRPTASAPARPIASDPAFPATADPLLPAGNQDSSPSLLWWLLLLIPLLLLLLLIGRLLWSSLSWRRHYRLIRRAHAGAGGAWLWTVAHLVRVGLAPPPHDSPDRIADGHLEGVAGPLQESVRALALVVTPAVFAPAMVGGGDEHDSTWDLARQAADEAWSCAGTGRRCRARWRTAPRLVDAGR